MEDKERKAYLKALLQQYGMLLLNRNPYFPSVIELGGDWNLIMELVDDRDVFVSKLFKSRTTYLSREMYERIKPFKQKSVLTECESRIIRFLDATGGADSEEIKSVLLLSDKSFDQSMNALLKNLSITVLNRGKTLNNQWSTLIWGTSGQWEKSGTGWSEEKYDLESSKLYVFDKLKDYLSPKQIENLLAK